MTDIIYYTATSTNYIGEEVYIVGTYHIPFLNFLLVFLVFIFTLFFLKFFYKIAYTPRKNIIDIRNKLSIAKRRIKNFFD